MELPPRLLALALGSCLLASGSTIHPYAPSDDGLLDMVATAVRGGERIAWNQAAPSLADLRDFVFTLYVDDLPWPLADVRCDDSPAAEFVCSGRLPALTPGWHVLQVSAAAGDAESERSAPLNVYVEGTFESGAFGPGLQRADGEACLDSTGGECFAVETITRGLEDIRSMSGLPDGRLALIEASRRIRFVDPADANPRTALGIDPASTRLVSLAIPPDFSTSRYVYVGSVESRGASYEFSATRYRDVDGVLGEGAVLVTGLPVGSDDDVPIAVDDAHRLYVALPAARGAGSGSAYAYNGFVLRFAADGTTPEGQSSPRLAEGYARPTQMAFDAARARLWLMGRDSSWGLPLAILDGAGTSSAALRAASPAMRTVDAARLGGRGPKGLAIVPGRDDPRATRLWLLAEGSISRALVRDDRLDGVRSLTLAAGTPYRIAAGAHGALFVAVREAAPPPGGRSAVLRVTPRPAP